MTPSGSQTVGPFFNFGLTANAALGTLAGPGARGKRIRLRFRVFDGTGAPSPGDAMIELWQADAEGRYPHAEDPQGAQADPHFQGFGRLETSPEGVCEFETVKPGRVPGPGGTSQAPHVNVIVFARGLLRHLHTRLYFAGDAANEHDPVLNLVPAARRATLLAAPGEDNVWQFDIRLQGGHETVFFDL
ncbi:MAG: protocatechuate 3,4-dioxygenase subunit alpha [Acidobacteria bacterium]|nr:protocatechuate 3,4-dioxygenase subunit alpha [Acidobacteriota bacterium]